MKRCCPKSVDRIIEFEKFGFVRAIEDGNGSNREESAGVSGGAGLEVIHEQCCIA